MYSKTNHIAMHASVVMGESLGTGPFLNRLCIIMHILYLFIPIPYLQLGSTWKGLGYDFMFT